ncbi:unnamed protein product, partial [Schistocephalus solidus]|uniref:Bravo_FIGEY domain-containing protein n=1 Tax=Schistocephalus solidus TaxID=70667 RepID=A0A183SF35_SCHSO
DREERALGNDPEKEFRDRDNFRVYERSENPPVPGCNISLNDKFQDVGSDDEGELDSYGMDPVAPANVFSDGCARPDAPSAADNRGHDIGQTARSGPRKAKPRLTLAILKPWLQRHLVPTGTRLAMDSFYLLIPPPNHVFRFSDLDAANLTVMPPYVPEVQTHDLSVVACRQNTFDLAVIWTSFTTPSTVGKDPTRGAYSGDYYYRRSETQEGFYPSVRGTITLSRINSSIDLDRVIV